MLRIFISHASADSKMAHKLCEDLKNTGHEVVVDLHSPRMGDDFVVFINEAIEQADIIIVLYSKATREAKWQMKELSAALRQEVENEGVRLIILRLDEVNLPPLLGVKIFGSLTKSNYDDIFTRLCSDLLPESTATSLFSQALAVGTANPFWRVRAEYFDEDWPQLLADAFSPPGAAKIGTLEEMMPCFLEGPRGTGKTMLLLSLRARILASRTNAFKTVKEIFGFYVRLDRGAFCNAGIKVSNNGDLAQISQSTLLQLAETFAQEFYLNIIESILSELSFCFNNSVIHLSGPEQAELARLIHSIALGRPAPASYRLESVLEQCAEVHQRLSEFVRRRFIYEETCTTPIATLDLDALKRIITTIRRMVPELRESQFTLLLDEYENLFAYQQTVVNSVVKLGPPYLSVKIARKVGTHQTSRTSIGQDLQEIHDYSLIPLVYSVEGDADCRRYIELLESIARNLLKSQDLDPQNLSAMLPEEDASEVEPERILEETLSLLKMTREEFERLSPADQKAKSTYYREAATYRLVYGKRGVRGEKRFCGVRELAFISSGVIRWFQEILGMAYHLEYGNRRIDGKVAMSASNQSRAVHIVSNHSLTALGRNVEEHGERLKYFLLDLGDCLRQKLLKHGSEPEAGRIAIINPELLETEKFGGLSEILRVGIREGVFQTPEGRPGMRPKHGEPQPVEFNIARIYAPALQFSPRLRWKTQFACADLRGLIDPDTRKTTKGKLMRKLAVVRKNREQAELYPSDGEP